ncbi:MAG: DUF1294 domain-containing protein [Oscillospiraceae bacterium]|nr:DUF1294 domain-containing protein [Oscillospiraceae bacterium]MBR4101724.1 DUF1294 domain-containing protein [Oscillospiraceae bacterium]
MQLIACILLAAYALLSVIAFCFYAADKKKAKKGAWRIPEKVLLGLGFLGGAIGALLGMKLLRHKTKHWYFWAVNIAGLLWQIALPVWLLLK